MPQFNQVPPYYMPEEKNGTQLQLNENLQAIIINSLTAIRAQADSMCGQLLKGADGLQWLCYLLTEKIVTHSSVVPADVDDTIRNRPECSSLNQTEIDDHVRQIIEAIKSIYSAHSKNLEIVQALVAPAHATVASAPTVHYSTLLEGLTVSDTAITPSAPPLGALGKKSLYSHLLPRQAAAASYGQLDRQVGVVVEQYRSESHVPGKQILDGLKAITDEIAQKVNSGDPDQALLEVWGLCDVLVSLVKQLLVIDERVISEEVAKFPHLLASRSSNPYIKRVEAACLAPDVASRQKRTAQASAGRSVSDFTPEETAVNGLILVLQEYIDKRAKQTDSSGKTLEYLHLGIFGSLNRISQNSFSQEKGAVEALIAVLLGNGSVENLQACLPVLKSGDLAKTISSQLSNRTLIKAVGGQIPAKGSLTIDAFVGFLIASQESRLKAGFN